VPQARERRVVPIPASEMQIPTTTEASLIFNTEADISTFIPSISSPRPAILESRVLTLEWPSKIRVGDADIIRLTLEEDEQVNTSPTDDHRGNMADGDKEPFFDSYVTHNVIAEARVEMAGLKIIPAETISEPLLPKEPVMFYWNLRPKKERSYRGTIWLYLRFIPNNGGNERRRVISVQFLEVEAISLFGISGGQARAMGAAGLLTSILLGIPFIENRVRRLWRKMSEQG